ncbi:MAG: TlpA disulfide reductase family protein [Planctomycetota bacterium]|nr:TlpA disulfide reductase family protein [Planctomycetota bacterium]MDA1213879.1 TlpA disulfide reductase family protein [Planctomycetota bacterium]
MFKFQHPMIVLLFAAMIGGFAGCGDSGPASNGTSGTESEPTPAQTTNGEAAPKGDGEDMSAESASSEPDSTDPETKTDTSSDTTQTTSSEKLLFKDLDELQELVAEHKGKVIVVDYWSTWCAPCIREFPHLVELQEKHGSDIVCISASCNYDGLPDSPPESFSEEIQTFLDEHKADKLTNVIMTVEAEVLFEQLNLASIPAVYVYNRDGELAQRFDNEDPDKLKESGEFSYEKDINPLVNELVAGLAEESQ